MPDTKHPHRRTPSNPSHPALVLLIWLLALLPTQAQELTPRRWSHLPMNTHLGGLGYVYTSADIYLDPVVQVEDLELSLNTFAMRYIRTFELLGKSSRIELGQGYQEGTWEGLLEGSPAKTQRSGFTDTLLRISTILYGAPPLEGDAFRRHRQSVADCETLIGAGLIVQLPTGDYSKQKLINLGTNRYTLRPQLGVVHQRGPWTFETSASLWFFTDNDDFWKNTHREQDILYTIQGHIIYTLRPGVWISSSIGYGYGGENQIDGVNKHDRIENLAWSLAAGYAITPNWGLKLAYVGTETQTDKGFDSNSIAVGVSFVW